MVDEVVVVVVVVVVDEVVVVVDVTLDGDSTTVEGGHVADVMGTENEDDVSPEEDNVDVDVDDPEEEDNIDVGLDVNTADDDGGGPEEAGVPNARFLAGGEWLFSRCSLRFVVPPQ